MKRNGTEKLSALIEIFISTVWSTLPRKKLRAKGIMVLYQQTILTSPTTSVTKLKK